MPEIIETDERYKDWYCEDLIRSYLSNLMDLYELLFKLDYDRIEEQKELFNFLNFLLTEKFPHRCYDENCGSKLYFSDTFNFAKKHLNLTLKEFVKLWITPSFLNNIKVKNVEIQFFCCKCFESIGQSSKDIMRFL
ncbi:MAG: hypothetical protein ACFE9R_17035 [Candidatus Hermodarchaeota archaeon]